MAKKPAQTEKEKSAILGALGSDVTKVRVTDKAGRQKWRSLDDQTGKWDVLPTDTIDLRKNGHPYVMKGQPGRRAVPVIPSASPQAADIVRAKNDTITQDTLRKIASKNPESPELIDKILEELAAEAASLRFERELAEKDGKDTSTLSMRRSKVLATLASTFIKKKEALSAGGIDLNSPQARVLIQYVLVTAREAMTSVGVRPEQVKTVFSEVSDRMNDPVWALTLTSKMKET